MAEINFRIPTASLTESRPQRESPVSGRLVTAQIHYPPGCNQLVEVMINHGAKQILPTPVKGGSGSDGIALNDATRPFSLNNRPVKQNDILEARVVNHDNTNPHTISVIIFIEESEQ